MTEFKTQPASSNRLSSREQAILLTLLGQAQPQRAPVTFSYVMLSKATGLSLSDTILGLVKLWLLGYLGGKLTKAQDEPMTLELRVGQSPDPPPDNLPVNGSAATGKGDYRGMGTSNESGLTSKTSFNKYIFNNTGNTGTGKTSAGGEKEGESVREGEKEVLAQEVAKALQDAANLGLYRLYAREYPRNKVLQALNRALSVPMEKIRKSRAALFTYWLKKKN